MDGILGSFFIYTTAILNLTSKVDENIMIKELVSEYRSMFPQKRGVLLIRALLCYKRMLGYRVIVLIRCKLNANSKNSQRRYSHKLLKKYGVEVGENCEIGKNLRIEHINGIVIGNGVCIGDDCVLYQQVTLGQKNGLYPRIGDCVTLYPGCKVIGNVIIGDNVTVGTNSVVLNDIPSNCVVAGIPAKVLKTNNKRVSL